MELESLNIREYPVASAALCRALLECTLKLWIDAEGGTAFDSDKLSTTYIYTDAQRKAARKCVLNATHAVVGPKETFLIMFSEKIMTSL